MKTKKMCLIGIMTALYCVLSAMVKFTVIGNIQIDLGYVVLTVACATLGPWAGFVGAVGCALESTMFSAYGFSISWAVANLIVGIGCGAIFDAAGNSNEKLSYFVRIVSIIAFTGFGVFAVKTGIECMLYNIPIAVKIPKNLTAWVMDALTMFAGLPIVAVLNKHNFTKNIEVDKND